MDQFRKSSFCAAGECVEVGFRTSSRCGSATCVEVDVRPDAVLVRDGKDPDGPVLTFTNAEWAAFLAGAKAGEFDVAN